jgi:SAM-dependent methyltransferase
MNISEYKNIYDNEEKHFYYVGYHKILLSLIDKHLGKKKKLKILDAGCGTGLFAKKLKRFGNVYGIDASLDAVTFARKRGLNIKKASISRLPFKSNYFDLVVSNDVICHKSIKNDQEVVKELTRVLKPGGVLLLKLPAFSWLMGAHDKQVHTKKRYTNHDVETFLKRSNNKLIKSTYLGSFLVLPVLIKNKLDNIINKPSYSSVQTVWQPVNNFLIFLFTLENFFVSFLNIPIGITIMTISIKTNAKKEK